jgi:hypothetical protein
MSRKAPRFLSISPPFARRVSEAQQRATQEADMTRQRALSWSHKSIAVTALVALGILVREPECSHNAVGLPLLCYSCGGAHTFALGRPGSSLAGPRDLHLQPAVSSAGSLPDVGIILAAALRHRRSALVTGCAQGQDGTISRTRQILPQISLRDMSIQLPFVRRLNRARAKPVEIGKHSAHQPDQKENLRCE